MLACLTLTGVCSFVQTDMGGAVAAVLGMEKPPMTTDESATGVLQRVGIF
jgi:hypothetical protein